MRAESCLVLSERKTGRFDAIKGTSKLPFIASCRIVCISSTQYCSSDFVVECDFTSFLRSQGSVALIPVDRISLLTTQLSVKLPGWHY